MMEKSGRAIAPFLRLLLIISLILQSATTYAVGLGCGKTGCPSYGSCSLAMGAFTPTKKLLKEEATAVGALSTILHKSEDLDTTVLTWFEQTEARFRQKGNLTPMEYITLSYIYRSDFFELAASSSNSQSKMRSLFYRAQDILLKSYSTFTNGADSSAGDIGKELPHYVMQSASRQAKAFNNAVHKQYLKTGHFKLWTNAKMLVSTLYLQPTDYLLGFSLLTTAFYLSGGETIARYLALWITASTVEWMFHNYIGHMSAGMKILKESMSKKLGWLNNLALPAWYSHTRLHHAAASENYDLAKVNYDNLLNRLEKEDPNGIITPMAVRADNGASLGWRGIFIGFMATAPITLAVHFLLSGGFYELPLVLGISSAMVAASAYKHPLLHRNRKEVLENASKPLRLFLGLPYVEMMARYHYVHHRQWNTNYNLLFAADFLFGTLKEPELIHLVEMSEFELIGGSWSDEE